jgi:hypothetical protein
VGGAAGARRIVAAAAPAAAAQNVRRNPTILLVAAGPALLACANHTGGAYRWPNGPPGPGTALARFGPARRGPALCRHGGLPCRAVSDHRAEVAAQARH